MQYPAIFELDKEAGGYVVTFRDVPEAITQGESEAEAIAMAEEVLISAIEFYLEKKRHIPPASEARPGERVVSVPANVAAKVLLLNEMLAQNVGPSELARRMGTIPQNVNRLIDVRHTSKLESIEQAVGALGKRLELSLIVEVPGPQQGWRRDQVAKNSARAPASLASRNAGLRPAACASRVDDRRRHHS